MLTFLIGVVIVVVGGLLLVGAIKLLLWILAGIIQIIGSIFFDH